MKKLLILSLIFVFVLSGCLSQQVVSDEPAESPEPEISTTNVLDHTNFILTLPADYDPEEFEKNNRIYPLNEGEFPKMKLGISVSNVLNTPKSTLAKKKEFFENLCTETESCPKIIEETTIEIDRAPGYYLVTEGNPCIGEEDKDLYGYIYMLFSGKTLLEFTAYDCANERSKELEKKLFEIINGIKIK